MACDRIMALVSVLFADSTISTGFGSCIRRVVSVFQRYDGISSINSPPDGSLCQQGRRVVADEAYKRPRWLFSASLRTHQAYCRQT
jgi:hypothetical protein